MQSSYYMIVAPRPQVAVPPTEAIVCRYNQPPQHVNEARRALTNGEAVGPSRIASSSGVKGRRGIMYIRTGTSRKMTSGNPIAAVPHLVSGLLLKL
jgi:hypothetical protein